MKYEDAINNGKEEELQTGEQLVTSYGASSTPHKKNASAEEYARKICFTEEEFEELKAHNFYRDEAPVNEDAESTEGQVSSLDAADDEGYVSEAEVEHLKALWRHVG